MGIKIFDSTALRKFANYRAFGAYTVTMPVSDVAQNVSSGYISPTNVKALEPQNPTSFFPMKTGSGNYFPCLPLKYPAYDGSAATDVTKSYGAFVPTYDSSASAVAAAANVWSLRNLGFDTRFTSTAQAFRDNMPDLLDYYVSYVADVPAMAAKAGADVSITVDTGFYPTGVWLERKSSASGWWPPMISVAPASNQFPTTSTTFKVRLDMCAGFNFVANCYQLRVVGFKTPFPLAKADILCAAMAATAAKYQTPSVALPAGFKMLGCYMVGFNAGNYFNRPWGMITLSDTSAQAIIAQPNEFSTAVALAAGDIGVRCVGVIC